MMTDISVPFYDGENTFDHTEMEDLLILSDRYLSDVLYDDHQGLDAYTYDKVWSIFEEQYDEALEEFVDSMREEYIEPKSCDLDNFYQDYWNSLDDYAEHYFYNNPPCYMFEIGEWYENPLEAYHDLVLWDLPMQRISMGMLAQYASNSPGYLSLRSVVTFGEDTSSQLAWANAPDVQCFIEGSEFDFVRACLDPVHDWPPPGDIEMPMFVYPILSDGSYGDLIRGQRLTPEAALSRQLKFQDRIKLIHCDECKLPVSPSDRNKTLMRKDRHNIAERIYSYGFPCPPGTSEKEAEHRMEVCVKNAKFLLDQCEAYNLPTPILMLHGIDPADYALAIYELIEHAEYGATFWIGLGGFENVGKSPLEYWRLYRTIRAIRNELQDERILGLHIPGLTWLPAIAGVRHVLDQINPGERPGVGLSITKLPSLDKKEDQAFLTTLGLISDNREFPAYNPLGDKPTLFDPFLSADALRFAFREPKLPSLAW